MDAQVERIEDKVTTVVVEPTTIESETAADQKVRVEELKINRDSLVTFFKGLIHKGEIRSLAVQNKQGEKLIEIPLLVGGTGLILATALFPITAVIGVIAVSVANVTFVIERKE